jgi:hypothetical protein
MPVDVITEIDFDRVIDVVSRYERGSVERA